METTDDFTMKIAMGELSDLKRRYENARDNLASAALVVTRPKGMPLGSMDFMRCAADECRRLRKLWYEARLVVISMGCQEADVPEYIWEKS